MLDDSSEIATTADPVVRGCLCKPSSSRRRAWPDAVNRPGTAEKVLEGEEEGIIGSGQLHGKIECDLRPGTAVGKSSLAFNQSRDVPGIQIRL